MRAKQVSAGAVELPNDEFPDDFTSRLQWMLPGLEARSRAEFVDAVSSAIAAITGRADTSA